MLRYEIFGVSSLRNPTLFRWCHTRREVWRLPTDFPEGPELVEVAGREKRILLSKDKALLKRKEVVFGYLVREIHPERQLAEIVHLFGLKEQCKPLSRCLRCNGLLQPVGKEQIIERLEPLTKKYYDSFHQCPGCGKIYWPGTHRDKMLLVLGGALRSYVPKSLLLTGARPEATIWTD